MASNFVIGPPIKISAAFVDSSGAPIDYTTVEFSYSLNRKGTWPITLTYSPGGSGYGVILKSATGDYNVSLLTPSLAGLLKGGWQGIDGSGNIQAQTFFEIMMSEDDSGLF